MSLNKTYYIKTFGCQANKADSQRIAGDYQSRGWRPAPNWQQAGQIVINTCAVRQSAENRVDGLLHNIVAHFNQHSLPRPKIILTGCMNYHGQQELFKLYPMIDQVIPVNQVGFNQPAVRRHKDHAWVPISGGCNSFCTYCIVPYARGREHSRPSKDILSEVKDLSNRGYTKITLLGQNVNSYGLEKTGIGLRKLHLRNPDLDLSDLPSNQSQYLKPQSTPPFVKLLQQVSQIKNIKNIRFLTSNPWDFHDQLIQELATNKKLDSFIHLPVQSGSNSILKKMNRGYTRQDYLKLVKKIRRQVPDLILGTDIIVGFPTETKKDFQQTVDLAKQANFDLAFVARYSPRPNTVASRLYQDNISDQVKKHRWQTLDELINQNNLHDRPTFY